MKESITCSQGAVKQPGFMRVTQLIDNYNFIREEKQCIYFKL